MEDKITIDWQISDGYIGCMRPQSFMLNLDEFEDCYTREDIEDYINECAQEDFGQKVTYRITNLDKVINKIEEYLKKREEE